MDTLRRWPALASSAQASWCSSAGHGRAAARFDGYLKFQRRPQPMRRELLAEDDLLATSTAAKLVAINDPGRS
jgi:hypothetical protein